LFPPGKFPRVALAVAGLLAAASIVILLAVQSPWLVHFLSNVTQTGVLGWATVCSYVVARRSSGYLRQLWNLWVASLALLTAGEAMVVYLASFRGTPAATPWPSDILIFLWVVPAAMMFIPWSAEEQGRIKWLHALDFAQAGIVAVTAYLYFFYVPSLWEVEGTHMFLRLRDVTLARDVLLALAFLLRAGTLPKNAARSFLAKVGVLFLIIGMFEYMGLSDFEVTGRAAEWTGMAWIVPFLLATAFAATWDTTKGRGLEAPRASQGGWVASQVLPVCIPLLVILMGPRIAREQMTLAWVTIGASFACSALRMVLTNQGQYRVAEDLRRAEQALRRSEHMFSAAFRGSPDAVSISLFPEGNIIELNESYTRLTGYSREEALTKTPQELGLWTDPELMAALRTRFRERGEIRDEEFQFRRKDGEIRGGRMSATTITLDGRVCALVIVRDITERKQAEEAVRATEERFRTLIRDLQVGVVLVRPDHEIQFANPAALQMFRTKRDDFVGRKVPELGLQSLYEDGTEMPLSTRPVARALETRQPIRGVVMGWRLPDSGEILWILGNAIPQLTKDGDVEYVIGSFADITDLKKAEEEKRVSQEMFTKAFHSSPDSMTISTLAEGRYIEVNEGYTRMFGWSREEAIGKTTLELGIWPDPAHREKLKEALRKHGRVSQMEFQLRTKAGQLRTIMASADVIELNGQACMLAVSDDITEWKRAQEDLRYSEERFRTLVQNLAVGVVLIGAEGQTLFLNPAAQRIFGMREEQLLGKKAWEIPLALMREDGSDLPKSMRPVPRVLATGEPIHGMVLGLRRPGTNEVVWIFGNAVPQFATDGKIAGIIISFADITDQKRAEDGLRQLSTRLLRLQDEERRRLGRDLHDSLAQSVLAVNLNLAQVTQGSATLDEGSRKLLREARGMLQDMSRQIRTLSYLLHPPLLDELGLASAVKEYAHGFSERSGIRLEVGVSPGFGRLPQDAETALFRIVQESLANIQRHSGSPTARIRLDGKPARIVLEVSDQGHGIPEARGKKLKEPGGRFGVGIVGMRERMAQLGGTLEIESSKSGTTVRATLPLKAEALHAASYPRG